MITAPGKIKVINAVWTVEVDASRVGGIFWTGGEVVTVRDCATSARSYLAAYLWERRARWRPEREHKKAEANLRAWRKRLKEWEA